jgi:hypothetical protein
VAADAARPWGRWVWLLDSIAEAGDDQAGGVVVSGSHGGLSAGRYALQAGVFLAVFNDAGVGLERAGIAALALLQTRGIAACAVAHDSARIGEAASTWADGRLAHANQAAEAMGARPGRPLRDWLISAA